MKSKILLMAEPLLAHFFPRVNFNSRWFRNSRIGYIWCLQSLWERNILHLGRPMPWPCTLTCNVSNPLNVIFDSDNLDNFQSQGTYYQCYEGKIVIGKGSYIGPNVGIITSNHRKDCLHESEPPRDVIIGNDCWIGMNSVILPGVQLADNTTVGAGAVVTKSHMIPRDTLLGVPARSHKKAEF